MDVRGHLIDFDGDLATLLVIRDITQRKRDAQALEQRNAELLEMNRRLEKMHQAKDELTAMVSHELRTPLLTASGYVELLLGGSLGPVSDLALSRMRIAQQSLRSMSQLIEAMLTYHAVIDQEFVRPPKLEPFDVGLLSQEAASDLEVRSHLGAQQVVVELPEEPVMVVGDADLIRMVLANLLNNAARHAGQGAKIRITVDPEDAASVRIAVSDDGVGMPPELRERAFEPFVKSASSTEGTGLGLSIVRAILNAHHTDVTLTSVPGEGTCVSFVLPLARQCS